MLAIWTATTKRLGRHVTELLLLVFKDWNEDEVGSSGEIGSLALCPATLIAN